MRIVASVVVLCGCGGASAQVMLGQVDTFQDGTVQGWHVGSPHPAPPVNAATGGPAGAGDRYMQLTALGGLGAGSRLAAFNTAQWAGDYTAAGVTRITMDVRNFGPEDAALRLLFSDAVSGPPQNVAATGSVFVPAGGGWISVEFSVDAGSLITLQGSASAALANATELRLFHNPQPTFPPPPVNLVLGVDNISAVPGVGTAAVVGVGLGVWGTRRRR